MADRDRPRDGGRERRFDRPRRRDGEGRRDFDRPRRDFDRPREGGFDRPRRQDDAGRPDFDRPRRDFDRPREGCDRPRRDFDRPRRDFDRPRRDFDRPRRPFDRPREGCDRPPDRRGPGRPPFRSAPPRSQPAPPREDLLAEDEELVAGRRPVSEAFAARRQARRLIVVPDRRAALESIVLHATTLRLPIVEVEGGTLTSLTGFDGHQGVALAVARRRAASIDDMLARARALDEPPFVLILDSLEDPQNLGTLLRSAEACGVHGVVYPTRHAAPLTAAAIKASAGASEHLLLASVDNLGSTLADLRAAGLRLVGADEGAALRYSEADLRGPVALVVGGEERGISGALRRRLDMSVRIPMRGRVASLNAAVAGSVLLFAAAEQRGTPESGERAELPAESAVHSAPMSGPAEEAVPADEVAPSAEPAQGSEASPPAEPTEAAAAADTVEPTTERNADLLPGGPPVAEPADDD